MKKYWILQCLGWFAYSAVGIAINLSFGVALAPLLVGHAVLISASIGLTHLLRGEIRRRAKLVVAGEVFAISVCQAGLVIGTNMLLTRSRWDPTSMLALWWGMLLATGIWTVLYVRFSERRGFDAREAQLQLALREAELRALEAQINPHFLFNCLNSIRALVEMEPARAQDMLTRLANVLRQSLSHPREHTRPLALEMETVSDYVALETVRFADRLRAVIEVDPAAAGCPVPAMVLQTLVENAVKHGISKVAGPGELLIRAQRLPDALRLVIENTGELAAAAPKLEQVGLRNVRERLQLLYGERGTLKLEGAAGRVTATLSIPV
ncbi:MAG: histidine kinase [Bryobacteraceae bacterium]|nr:histidine kinase [Bryobacteraceae bacterium]